jgi:Flp pilus assembly protein TadD
VRGPVLLRIVIGVWLAGVLLAAGGCASSPWRSSGEGSYQTVTPEPRRDTDAARHDDEVGLDLLAQGKLDEAAEAFGRALTADVEYGPAHNNLGKVYYRQNDLYKAAWEFEYAKKLMPRRAEPRNNLGLVLEQAGELDRAVEEFGQAVALGAGNIEYRANLARVLVRRGDRTEEVRSLLRQVIKQDTRSEWVVWARQQLAILEESHP